VPTWETTNRFDRDLDALTQELQRRFRDKVVDEFVPDLEAGVFRAGLRVKGVQGAPGIFELTWAPDGRATWQYGEERTPGDPHIIWRRVGTHEIFRAP
jgi:hypothetical protein